MYQRRNSVGHAARRRLQWFVAQSQKIVSAYLTSKQILPSGNALLRPIKLRRVSFALRSTTLTMRTAFGLTHSAVQSQKAVSAYFTSEQILSLGLQRAPHYCSDLGMRENTPLGHRCIKQQPHHPRRWPNVNPVLYNVPCLLGTTKSGCSGN